MSAIISSEQIKFACDALKEESYSQQDLTRMLGREIVTIAIKLLAESSPALQAGRKLSLDNTANKVASDLPPITAAATASTNLLTLKANEAADKAKISTPVILKRAISDASITTSAAAPATAATNASGGHQALAAAAASNKWSSFFGSIASAAPLLNYFVMQAAAPSSATSTPSNVSSVTSSPMFSPRVSSDEDDEDGLGLVVKNLPIAGSLPVLVSVKATTITPAASAAPSAAGASAVPTSSTSATKPKNTN
jgi:hypothetical protein